MNDYASLRIKPHGAFYLIPVLSLIIGFGIGVALLVTAALHMSLDEFSAGDQKYINVKGPETVSILSPLATSAYVHVTKVEKNRYLVTFNSHTEVEFTFLDINHSDTEITMEKVSDSVNFYINDYNVILTINLPAEGNYLIKTKYSSAFTNPYRMAIGIGIGQLFQSMFIGILSSAIGFLVALTSFVVITSRRSSSRRKIRELMEEARSASVRL